MLSTFILMPRLTDDAPPALGALVRTLAALVPATVEGLVRDVTVIASGPNDGIRRVAEHAGCGLVENEDFDAGLRTAFAAARSTMLFLLQAGAFLDREFLDEAARQFSPEHRNRSSQSLLIREAPNGLVTRVLPDLAPVAGLIAPLSQLGEPAKDFASLVRGVRGTQTLTARASMAK